MTLATDQFENETLAHYLTNAAHAGIGDATGLPASATAGSLFLSLHSADPGETGNQTTSEVSYGAYARVGVTRAGGSWNIASGSATNANLIQWPLCTSGSATATHVGIGTASSGTGKLLFRAPIVAGSLSIVLNGTPEMVAGALTVSVS